MKKREGGQGHDDGAKRPRNGLPPGSAAAATATATGHKRHNGCGDDAEQPPKRLRDGGLGDVGGCLFVPDPSDVGGDDGDRDDALLRAPHSSGGHWFRDVSGGGGGGDAGDHQMDHESDDDESGGASDDERDHESDDDESGGVSDHESGGASDDESGGASDDDDNADDGRSPCGVCGKLGYWQRKDSLKRHKRAGACARHAQQAAAASPTCGECGRTFSSKQRLQSHVQGSNDGGPVCQKRAPESRSCGMCGETFTRVYARKDHEKKGECQRRVCCQLCHEFVHFDEGDVDGDHEHDRHTPEVLREYHRHCIEFGERSPVWKTLLKHLQSGRCRGRVGFLKALGRDPVKYVRGMCELGYRGTAPKMTPEHSDSELRVRVLYLAAFSPYSVVCRAGVELAVADPQKCKWWKGSVRRGRLLAGRKKTGVQVDPGRFVQAALQADRACVPVVVRELAHDWHRLCTRGGDACHRVFASGGGPTARTPSPDLFQAIGPEARFFRDTQRPQADAAEDFMHSTAMSTLGNWLAFFNDSVTLVDTRRPLSEPTETYADECGARQMRWIKALEQGPKQDHGVFRRALSLTIQNVPKHVDHTSLSAFMGVLRGDGAANGPGTYSRRAVPVRVYQAACVGPSRGGVPEKALRSAVRNGRVDVLLERVKGVGPLLRKCYDTVIAVQPLEEPGAE